MALISDVPKAIADWIVFPIGFELTDKIITTCMHMIQEDYIESENIDFPSYCLLCDYLIENYED